MSEELRNLVSLLDIPENVQTLSATLPQRFSEVNEKLKNISQNIQNISGPVRELEIQRINTKKALVYIEDIITFHTKLRELQAALKFDNLPYAALLCGEISAIPVRYVFAETQEFIKLKAEVCEKVKKTFGEALSDNKKAVVEQYAGLFHHLELGREGIESYIKYIIESLRSQFDSISDLLVSGASFEDCLIKIYRLTAKQYDTQYENITNQFGISGTLELLQQLQTLVDEYAVLVISKYIKQINPKYKTQGVCEEITKIMKHSESFEAYIQKLGKKLVESGAKVEDDRRNVENGLKRMSVLKAKVLELADLYISFESQYMQEGISVLLDKFTIGQVAETVHQEKNVLVTGTLFERLDDCFFILQNACSRVLSTLNINSICAILNNIAVLIKEKIIGTLSSKITLLKHAWSQSFTINNSTTILLINLLSTSKKCIKKLFTSLEQQFSKIFGDNKTDQIMFQNCIIDICDLETICKELLDQLLQSIVKLLNYKDLLTAFRSLSYDISLDQHSDYEVNDPFALRLIKELKLYLKQWSFQLSVDVFEAFVDGVVEQLTSNVEKEVIGKKFNELGALQFQKEVREIIAQVQNLSNKPLRHRFVRLKQISELLLAKDEEEVKGLVQDSEWKLSGRENRMFRSMRIN